MHVGLRFLGALCALVLVGVSGCGGGGNKDVSIAGSWTFDYVFLGASPARCSVPTVTPLRVDITQDGARIAVDYGGGNVFGGTIDEASGHFEFSGRPLSAPDYFVANAGDAQGGDRLAGFENVQSPRCLWSYSYTARRR